MKQQGNRATGLSAIALVASLLVGIVLVVSLLANFAQASLGGEVRITVLQLNDIYEITPVEGGARGGLARVATLRKRLLEDNPNTYTILGGDAFSPSALGTAKVNGERLAGQQMVAVMNAVGFDYATFGNHEFDLSEAQFLKRLQESEFQWISSNVTDAAGKPFPNVPRSQILTVRDAESGKRVRVGLLGLTIDSNKVDYVRYQDPFETAKAIVQELMQQRPDFIIAMTHLTIDEDRQLAAAVPEIDLILGGHEHENIQQWRLEEPGVPSCPAASSGTPIFKADANARTVYVYDLIYNTGTDCLQVRPRLEPITAAIPDDPATAKVVDEWVERGFQGFRDNGFQPEAVVATTTETLDGLESSVRNQPTNLTDLIAQAMLAEVEGAQLALFNGGMIRIDDHLPPGKLSQYDIIRIMPFGGTILSVEMPGELLQRALNQGLANRGGGGYLQTANVSQNETGNWLIQGKPLAVDAMYRVAINDFLVSGQEQGLGFFSLDAPGVKKLGEAGDIRFAVIRALHGQ